MAVFRFTQSDDELQYLINEIYQIAEQYDPSASYAVGDYCSYEGKIYRCTAATTGTFDDSKWTDSVIVMNALKTLKGRVDTAESDISTLNTSLANIEQYTNVTLTAGTNVTIDSVKKVSIGKIAGYAIQFTTSAALSVRASLMTGLARPVNSAAGYAIAQGMNTSNAAIYNFGVYSTNAIGDLRNLEALPAGTYRVGAIYLTI